MEHRVRKISVTRENHKTVVFVITELKRRIYNNPTASSLTRIKCLDDRNYDNEYTTQIWLDQEGISFSIWFTPDWQKEINWKEMREID